MKENIQENPSYFAVIPADVRYDKRLTPNAKLLYSEITALSQKYGYCWSTNAYFAKLYGVSEVSVSKWISSLIEYGYVKSTFTYIEGTKAIDKRYLSIVIDPLKEMFNRPLKEIFKAPLKEKFKDNNTRDNNTRINNTRINNYKKDFSNFENDETEDEPQDLFDGSDKPNSEYDLIKIKNIEMCSEVLKDISWVEDFSMKNKIYNDGKYSNFRIILLEFASELSLSEKTHKTKSEFKMHFSNWAKLKKPEELTAIVRKFERKVREKNDDNKSTAKKSSIVL